MTPSKSDLRKAAKVRRTGRESRPPTTELIQYLKNRYPYQSKIGCYLNKVGEMSTKEIVSDLASIFQLFAPSVQGKNIIWRKIDNSFQYGQFQIPEPTSEITIAPVALQCFLLPALAVDLQGNRLGFGAGYFDRNLKDVSAEKIALVFDEDILDYIPRETHDVAIDLIATESKLIKISN